MSNKQIIKNQKSKAVANFFYNKAKNERCTDFTVMKAIKLVYISHGWTLALTEEPLIDDIVEAWQYGAVVPSVYHALKFHGSQVIEVPIFEENFNDYWEAVLNKDKIVKTYTEVTSEFTKNEEKIMTGIWNVYKKFSGFELSDLMHKKGTPWDKIWNGSENDKTRRMEITNDSIKAHFKTLYK